MSFSGSGELQTPVTRIWTSIDLSSFQASESLNPAVHKSALCTSVKIKALWQNFYFSFCVWPRLPGSGWLSRHSDSFVSGRWLIFLKFTFFIWNIFRFFFNLFFILAENVQNVLFCRPVGSTADWWTWNQSEWNWINKSPDGQPDWSGDCFDWQQEVQRLVWRTFPLELHWTDSGQQQNQRGQARMGPGGLHCSDSVC